MSVTVDYIHPRDQDRYFGAVLGKIGSFQASHPESIQDKYVI